MAQPIASRESIAKACRELESMPACIYPSRSDRQRKAAYQTFYIWWRFVVSKPDKVMTYFDCYCEVDLIYMLCVLLNYYDMGCNDGAKIEQY